MKKTKCPLIAALFLLVLSSCENDPPPPPPSTEIHLDSTALLGRYIVDKDGKTLYFFSNDVDGQSACSGQCTTNWPAFLAPTDATFGAGLTSSDFTTITLASGAKQTAFKGWPLYYYAPAGVAEAPGQTTGEGLGEIWFVAKPDYSIMIANYQLTGANGVNYLSDYTPGDGRTKYFTDGMGNTLYAFGRDSSLKNKYTRPDFTNDTNWPMYQTENITVPSILDKTQFAVIDFNGRKQLTYKGWPMYYFGQDAYVRGANKGVSIPATQPPGSVWPVVVKDAAPAPTP